MRGAAGAGLVSHGSVDWPSCGPRASAFRTFKFSHGAIPFRVGIITLLVSKGGA